uniref:Uncharacterized protein n=1 Tax=Plectus sambesii TaxID=2011161 RepID=A0A914V9W2_9BILA
MGASVHHQFTSSSPLHPYCSLTLSKKMKAIVFIAGVLLVAHMAEGFGFGALGGGGGGGGCGCGAPPAPPPCPAPACPAPQACAPPPPPPSCGCRRRVFVQRHRSFAQH